MKTVVAGAPQANELNASQTEHNRLLGIRVFAFMEHDFYRRLGTGREEGVGFALRTGALERVGEDWRYCGVAALGAVGRLIVLRDGVERLTVGRDGVGLGVTARGAGVDLVVVGAEYCFEGLDGLGLGRLADGLT